MGRLDFTLIGTGKFGSIHLLNGYQRAINGTKNTIDRHLSGID